MQTQQNMCTRKKGGRKMIVKINTKIDFDSTQTLLLQHENRNISTRFHAQITNMANKQQTAMQTSQTNELLQRLLSYKQISKPKHTSLYHTDIHMLLTRIKKSIYIMSTLASQDKVSVPHKTSLQVKLSRSLPCLEQISLIPCLCHCTSTAIDWHQNF